MNDSHLQHISDQLDAAGLLWGRTRDLVLTVTQHGRVVGEQLVCQMTNAALAEALDCSKRTIKRELAALREEGLSWLTFESGQWGHLFRIDTYRPQDRPGTNPGQTRDKGGTDPGQTQAKPPTGTVPATCAPDPPEESSPTENLKEGRSAHTQAPARGDAPSSLPPLLEFLNELLAKYDYDPADPVLWDQRIAPALGRLEDDEQRRCYMTEIIAKMCSRSRRYRQFSVIRALWEDLEGWQGARAMRDALAQPTPEAQRRPARTPSQHYESPGWGERLEEAVAHGTRNNSGGPVETPTERRRKAAELKHRQLWRVAQEAGVVGEDEDYSPHRLVELGFLEAKDVEVER